MTTLSNANGDGPEFLNLDAALPDGGDGNEDRGDNFGDEPVVTKPAAKAAAEPPADDLEDGELGDGPKIPKGRLNEVILQRDLLRDQLAEAKRLLLEKPAAGDKPATTENAAETTPPPTANAELKALRTRYREALMEGDLETAGELDDLIDAAVVSIAEKNIEAKQAKQSEQTSLQTTSDQAITDYPYLDTEDGAEALELIVMKRDQNIRSGMAPSAALKAAVDSIAPRFAPTNEDGTPLQGLPAATKAVDTRSNNANARGAADSNKQPPSMQAGVGNRATNTKVDVNQLSEGQFKDLTDADKKRMRGD